MLKILIREFLINKIWGTVLRRLSEALLGIEVSRLIMKNYSEKTSHGAEVFVRSPALFIRKRTSAQDAFQRSYTLMFIH
jgi:hypothetical protein